LKGISSFFEGALVLKGIPSHIVNGLWRQPTRPEPGQQQLELLSASFAGLPPLQNKSTSDEGTPKIKTPQILKSCTIHKIGPIQKLN